LALRRIKLPVLLGISGSNNTRLRRAGLDYKELAQVFEYENFEHYLDKAKPERLFAVSSKVQTNYAEVEYQEGDSFQRPVPTLYSQVLRVLGVYR
jgi:hypothetical protein